MFEEKLPFIAAIVAEVIVVGIAFLFFENYFFLTALVAIISIFITSKLFNPWAMMASVLLTLSAAAIETNDTRMLYLIWGLFLLGTILQLSAALATRDKSTTIPGSTLTVNTMFALIGVSLSYLLIYWIYQNYYGGSLVDEVGLIFNSVDGTSSTQNTGNTVSTLGLGPISIGWLTIMGTFVYFSLEPFFTYALANPSGQIDTLPLMNTMAHALFRALILGPLVWASLFAAISEVRFRIFHFKELFQRFIVGLVPLNRIGCLTTFMLAAILVGFMLSINQIAQNPQMLDYFMLAAIGTIILSLSLGAAYNVTRNK